MDRLLKPIGYWQIDTNPRTSTASYHCKEHPITSSRPQKMLCDWMIDTRVMQITLPPLSFIGQSQLNVVVAWKETARPHELVSDSNGR